MDILLDIEKEILEGEPKPVKHEYFESSNDPPMEEFPEFLETDLKLLSETMIKLNNQICNEKEFEETMENFDRKTKGIKQRARNFMLKEL
jgi:hypothetical protein